MGLVLVSAYRVHTLADKKGFECLLARRKNMHFQDLRTEMKRLSGING